MNRASISSPPDSEIRWTAILRALFYGRFYPENKGYAVVVFPAKDLDVAYLPETWSADFAEICSALDTLQELMDHLSRLAGFHFGSDIQV